MDVEVECRGDAGVAEYHADGLVVAHTLDAPGGETVAQSVELHCREVQRLHQLLVVVAVGARFGGGGFVGYDVEIGVYYCHYRAQDFQQLLADGDFTVRVSRLGRGYDDLRFCRGRV